MKDPVEHLTGWRFVIGVILLFYIAWMTAFGTFVTVLWFYEVLTEPPRVVSSRAHKYHGIQASWNYNNTWYFTRDWRDHYNKERWIKL